MRAFHAIAVVLPLALTLASPVVRADPADLLLDGVDTVPDAAAWRRLGPAGEARLAAIAGDRDAPIGRRARAVSALAHFPSDATRKLLATLLSHDDAPSLLRRKAALSLARAFGDMSVATLAAQAGAADPRLRDDVARALGSIGTARARAVLQRRLAVEGTWVRRTIERALRGAP